MWLRTHKKCKKAAELCICLAWQKENICAGLNTSVEREIGEIISLIIIKLWINDKEQIIILMPIYLHTSGLYLKFSFFF